MTHETDGRPQMVATGRSLFDRGLSPGRTGNLSIRSGSGWLMTPTGASLGGLATDHLSSLDSGWQHRAGPLPTKEVHLHAALYDTVPWANAVIHLHSPHAVAVSCLQASDDRPILRPLTPYFVMRVGSLAWVPYRRPGDPALADDIRRIADGRHAVMLANHGPIVAGHDLASAADAIEELEATAHLELLLTGHSVRTLSLSEVEDLARAVAG